MAEADMGEDHDQDQDQDRCLGHATVAAIFMRVRVAQCPKWVSWAYK